MTYPLTPGWKDEVVSRQNARANARRFPKMRQRVLELFEKGFVGSADDAAYRLDLSPFSVRPRCTELLKLGKLERVRIKDVDSGRARWWLKVKRP